MDLAAAFGEIGLGFSSLFGGPYWPAQIITQGAIEYDDGGSIIPGSGAPTLRGCSVQIDTATQAMREAEGFVDTDVRFIILAATLEGSIGTDERVEVLSGPFAGIWSVSALERDPVAAGWVGRGRLDQRTSNIPPNALTYGGEPMTYGGEIVTYGDS